MNALCGELAPSLLTVRAMKKSTRPTPPSITTVSLSSLARVTGGERVKTSDKQQAAVLAFIKG